ncbi:MAG: DUF805 domain-containing protein [Paracoccaceae bacterium]
MDFSTAVRTCFQKYVVFTGRAQRSEFWYFVLFNILGSIVLGIVDSILFGWASDNASVLGGIFGLIMFLPSISVAVRRLHDTDRSGWWWWLWLIPLIGWIILIVWYATAGTNGPNRFGPDPLEGASGGGEEFAHRSSIPSVARKD